MITVRKLVEYLSAEPFQPFRVTMASGQTYDIRHPEMITVGRNSARVFAASELPEAEKWHDLSLLLMEAVEPLEQAPVR